MHTMLLRVTHQVTAHFEYILSRGKKLDPRVVMHAAGSYRRGSADSGDVDVLVSHPDEECAQDLLAWLLEVLQSEDYIDAMLSRSEESTIPEQADDPPGPWCHTCCLIARLPDAHALADLPRPLRRRRVDIKVYPWQCLPFALLYFTGSEHFNRSMRFYAKQVRGVWLGTVVHDCGCSRVSRTSRTSSR